MGVDFIPPLDHSDMRQFDPSSAALGSYQPRHDYLRHDRHSDKRPYQVETNMASKSVRPTGIPPLELLLQAADVLRRLECHTEDGKAMSDLNLDDAPEGPPHSEPMSEDSDAYSEEEEDVDDDDDMQVDDSYDADGGSETDDSDPPCDLPRYQVCCDHALCPRFLGILNSIDDRCRHSGRVIAYAYMQTARTWARGSD